MLTCKSTRSAFTLIELLVVVIIVAVLASVGLPLLSANVVKAKASEAVAALGTIRTGMRAQLAEFGAYSIPAALDDIGIKQATAGPPPTPGDLDGRYFLTSQYTVAKASSTTFCAQVVGTDHSATSAPGADKDTATITRSIDQDGNITTGVCP